MHIRIYVNKSDGKLTINSSAGIATICGKQVVDVNYYLYNIPGGCFEKINYVGTICSDELSQQQSCFSELETNEILISPNVSQEVGENAAIFLLRGLPLLSPSQKCMLAIKPFMCLYLFGLCDVNNQLHQVSQADCVRIRDELCVEQWKRATMIPGVMLPDCSTFKSHDI